MNPSAAAICFEQCIMELPQALQLGAIRIAMAYKKGVISRRQFEKCVRIHIRSWDQVPVRARRLWLVDPYGESFLMFI